MDTTLQLHFFRFKGLRHQFWAFTQMQLAHSNIQKSKGITFYKLLGTGGGDGFQWYPDFSTYALLIQFEEEGAATAFRSSEVFKNYVHHAVEHAVFHLQAYESHGYWSKEQPFILHPFQPEQPIAVITRARIKWKYLWKFWRDVPAASKSLEPFTARWMGKGIGEWPLIQQATFSIWASQEQMMDFAYRNPEHRKVIQKTRKLGWYSEEMFARFHPVGMEGTWRGQQWKF
jgi:hypothetical protein